MKPSAFLMSMAFAFISVIRSFATSPNVVIILTDDQGWGDVGYHTYPGRVHIDTPNMDSFATSGIRLERFYPTAVCSVTRSTMLTGRSAIRTSVNNTHGLDLSEHIIPQTFKAAGYQTIMSGKWHIGGPENDICYKTVSGKSVRVLQEGNEYRPYNRGWDSHYGEYSVIDAFTHHSTDSQNPDIPDWWLNSVQYAENDASQHTDLQGHGGYATDLLADHAVSQILNRDPSKPLLLYLAFSQIHGPVSAPPSYLTKYGTASDPTHYIADSGARTIAASVDCMDVAMGRVLNALDTAGITDNTIVVYMSDNGGENATGGSDLPLRGAKSDPYEGGIRTPAGIRWPGHLAGGVISNQFIWIGDMFPTLCAATGVTPLNTKPFDGINMWPALQSISGTNPDGTQTRFQTNPDGSKNATMTNISPLVTAASPNVGFNTFVDPTSGQTRVFKLIYNKSGTNAVIVSRCLTVAGTAVTCDSTTGLTSGMSVYGVGLKGGSTITSITNATNFVLSDAPNVPSTPSTITINAGFPVNELFNIQDDPYETTDIMLGPNAASYSAIVASLTTAIGITPEIYPPYVGPPLITNTAAQGGTIQLYAPFTCYPFKQTPVVHWRKNGVNLTDGGSVSGSSNYFQAVAPDGKVYTPGAYTTTLSLTNLQPGDAGNYDVVISNINTNVTPNVTQSTTSQAGTLTVSGALGAPVLPVPPAFTKGTALTLIWPAVATATSYTVQVSGTADFSSILAAQTPASSTVSFSGLSSSTTYYYRATATDGVTTSAYSNVVSSTQDAGNPQVVITSPANGSTTGQTSLSVQGTASDATSGVASVVVNGVTATSIDNFAHWSATVPLSTGSNTLTATVTDNAQSGGNSGTASVSVTLSPSAPVISSVSIGPTLPTYLDPVWVSAQVSASQGTAISQVCLSYDLGTPLSTRIFQEVFSVTSSNNWGGTGALNAWTTTGGSNTRQSVGASNNTVPIGLTSCATTSGSTTVTCNSTTSLWPGMSITGPNVPAGTKISSIIDGTSFVMSANASGSGSVLSLTAAGMTLINCTTTSGSPSVTCDSTVGLVSGMSLAGTGVASSATVSSVTDATHFVMSANATVAGTGVTFTAAGAASEFQTGTANLSDTMITTTNAINTSGSAGNIEFYLQTRDLAATNNNTWTFQVSPDGGTTWNTRISESWNGSTVNLSNCVLNSTGSVSGSKNVTCASTAGLVVGSEVDGSYVFVSGTTSSASPTVNCTNTTGLVVGMFVQGTGIPNNARITALTTNISFTMSASATATGSSVAIAAGYFASTATVSSITSSTVFVLSTAAYVNTSSSPVSATITTLNHGFQKYHYDLAGTELGTQTKLRFQFAGYTPTSPLRAPRVDVDDIIIATTAVAPSVIVTMVDDGLHGDGAAGDGIYGAAIPVQAGGTTVNFHVTATDSNGSSSTSPVAGGYTYTVNSLLTDSTITSAEFLGIPTDQSITLNVVMATDQDAFVEYGTTPGSYSGATAVTSYPAANGPVEITLAGLQPNTKYYYRLRHRASGQTAFNARGERSFRTARPRGAPFVFTVTADPHLDEVTDKELFGRTMSNIRSDQPDLHIDLGDIFMTDKLSGFTAELGGGLPSQSRVNTRAVMLRALFEQTCHSVPFFYTLGNHEAEYGYLFNTAADKQNNIPAWNLKARKAFYPTPVPSSFYTGNATPMDYTGGTLGLLEDYYAWEWGDALFIVLDPFWNTLANANTAKDGWKWSLGKAQYDWLKATLQNSSAGYKFVFMHHIIGGSIVAADGSSNLAARGGVEVADKYEWGGKNADGSDGFETNRPGWGGVPIHNLLVQNKVNVVFHGHDHLYGYQTLDGMVYLECPQPGTANFTGTGSSADGQYSTGVLLPNSGHIRVSVGPNGATSEYVRAYRAADENATRHNQDISHSFTLSPRIFPPIEMTAAAAGQASFRWNAVANKTYSVQWSADLVNWTTIDTVIFSNTNTNATYTDTAGARVNQARVFYRVSYTP